MKASHRETIKGLIQIVWADGRVDDRERILLGHMLSELGLTQEDLLEVGQMMQEAPELPDLDEILKSPSEDQEDLLRVLMALSMSRGSIKAPELRYIQAVAHRLAVSPQRLEELKIEVRQLPDQTDC